MACDRRLGARAALETTAAEEGLAYGAALLAGCRAGVFAGPREAAEWCVRIAERREPNPEWAAVYREGYERYRCLYPALAPATVIATAATCDVGGSCGTEMPPSHTGICR